MTMRSAPVALVTDDLVDDRLLVQRSTQGDVYNLALRNMGDGNAAEEITQDAFARLYRSLPDLRFDSTLSTWLYRVTVNLGRDRWRQGDRANKKEVSLDEVRFSR